MGAGTTATARRYVCEKAEALQERVIRLHGERIVGKKSVARADVKRLVEPVVADGVRREVSSCVC